MADKRTLPWNKEPLISVRYPDHMMLLCTSISLNRSRHIRMFVTVVSEVTVQRDSEESKHQQFEHHRKQVFCRDIILL